MNWAWLFMAGLLEIAFTTSLKYSENFTKTLPTVSFFLLAFLSLSALSLSIRTIPLGTAYAIWTGIGAFGTAVIGIAFFGESTDIWRIVFLLGLILSVVGLKLVS